ncbi:hypothetical protein H6P81_014642 [Aristolochia fimbriata]|uniref:Uncharacterized protein n=1 Tax=Aristolochia fimbriata TaxID=158543 RepID=A0AAV7E3A3_ARIFI|nr:hypothetical protein H6P81_014642 [Aristolochia fimbriata]
MGRSRTARPLVLLDVDVTSHMDRSCMHALSAKKPSDVTYILRKEKANHEAPLKPCTGESVSGRAPRDSALISPYTNRARSPPIKQNLTCVWRYGPAYV